MIFREALIGDIQQMQVIRNLVKENVLSDPNLVTVDDYRDYLLQRGKGWVCEEAGEMIGFAIADIKNKNIWALFVHPEHEGKGAGRKLHNLMLNWYFSQSKQSVWLGTSPNTRAELFYRKAGWREIGVHGNGEIKFEMTEENWKRKF